MKLKNKLFLIISSLFLFSFAAHAQWQCRSELGAHLKPFHKEFPLLWAVEGTFGYGLMNDRDIRNAMIYGALDYTKNNHQFYAEIARKSWYNSLNAPDDAKFFQKNYFGPRELFYQYKNQKTSIVAGFQSMSMKDFFLMRERALGVKFNRQIGAFNLDISSASVLKDYARMGTFCSVKYLYNIIRDRYYPTLGQKVGQTNFAGVVLSYDPSLKKDKSMEEDSGDDEFSSFNEFSSMENEKYRINKTGLIYYAEFGKWVPDVENYFGAFVDFPGPMESSIKAEALYQMIPGQNAILYYLKASKLHFWKSGSKTAFAFTYFGSHSLDEKAFVNTSFTNLFAGEVMRMDAHDMPMYQVAFKQNYPKFRIHTKLQWTQQFKYDKIREIDWAIGKRFYKNFKLTCIFSKVDAKPLSESYYMGRAELRITF